MLSLFIEAVQELSLQISLFLSSQRLLFSLLLTNVRWRNSDFFVPSHSLDSLANQHERTSTPSFLPSIAACTSKRTQSEPYPFKFTPAGPSPSNTTTYYEIK